MPVRTTEDHTPNISPAFCYFPNKILRSFLRLRDSSFIPLFVSSSPLNMHCFKIAITSTAVATALAGTVSNPFSPIPGYPLGNGICLTDQQSQFLVKTFVSALANTNRAATNATLQALLASNYAEESDSINTLAGYPVCVPSLTISCPPQFTFMQLNSISFPSKAAYLASLLNAPPTPPFQILQSFHDCTNIGFRWIINGLGKNIDQIKGINQLVANPLTGQLSFDYLEFNSIAWGRDVGWTCTPPS